MLGISCPPLCYEPVDEVLVRIAQHFRLWEIVAEHLHHHSKALPKLRALLPSYSVKMQVHAPLSDINIGSINEGIRNASIREIKDAVMFARQIDATVVTIHPGHMSPMTFENPKIVYSLTRQALEEITVFADDIGVKIALENMPALNNTICKNPDEIFELVNGTSAGICFDIGHANTTQSIDKFFELAHLFINVHVHDNDGKHDAHLTVGDGNIRFRQIVKRFKRYSGNYVIESRSIESAIKSKNYLAEMGY
jgi:sugar phosphate isomerase/epimerase